MALVKEDYMEQFTAMTQMEVWSKCKEAAARAVEQGCTFPCLTVFPEHRVAGQGDLFVFQAWKIRPADGECAPAEPALVPA